MNVFDSVLCAGPGCTEMFVPRRKGEKFCPACQELGIDEGHQERVAAADAGAAAMPGEPGARRRTGGHGSKVRNSMERNRREEEKRAHKIAEEARERGETRAAAPVTTRRGDPDEMRRQAEEIRRRREPQIERVPTTASANGGAGEDDDDFDLEAAVHKAEENERAAADGERVCAAPHCDNRFEPKRSDTRYCYDEWCMAERKRVQARGKAKTEPWERKRPARPGEREDKVLAYLEEHGPTRQADLWRAVDGLAGSDMPVLVRRLVDQGRIERGEKVDRSPVLSIPGVTAEPEPEPVELEPVDAVAEEDGAAPGPQVPPSLALEHGRLVVRYADLLITKAESPAADDDLFDRIERVLGMPALPSGE